MRALSLEGRVGLFVLGALVVLAGFVLALGDFSLGRRFSVYVDFAYAGGLRDGAPVKVSGVRVGRVADVQILSPEAEPKPAPVGRARGQEKPPWVRAKLRLDESARSLLTEGSELAVGMQGVIGEAYVELTPGLAGGPPMAIDQAQRGIDAPALHVMALQAATLLNLITNLGSTDDENAAPALAALLRTLNDVVSQDKDGLGQGLRDMTASVAELRQILSEVHSAIAGDRLGALVRDASESAHTLPSLLTQMRSAVGRVDELASRAERSLDQEALTAIVVDLRKAARTLEETSRDGQVLVGSLKRGEGSIGGLMKDPQIYDDLKELLRDLKQNPWKVFWRD